MNNPVMITAWAAMATAIAALLCPMVTAIITTRAEYRKRKMELDVERKTEIISRFAASYADLHLNTGLKTYANFMAAAYGLLSVTKSQKVRQKVVKVIKSVEGIRSTSEGDELFQVLMIELAEDW